MKKDSSYLCKDGEGNIFISFEKIPENQLSGMKGITHCLAVVKIGDDYLMGWNRWRDRYEVFGGCIEPGETPRECMIREGREELGIHSSAYEYLGVMKFLMQPDYFSPMKRIEFGILYGLKLQEIDVNDLFQKISDKDEIAKLARYSRIKGREPIALIDEKLLDFYS